jgi:hypothetical protein
VAEVESGKRPLDADVRPALFTALHALRAQVQRDPALVLRYLADMLSMRPADASSSWWQRDPSAQLSRNTLPLNVIKEPPTGDGSLTLAEAALLYRAFFPADEPIDLSNLRRRFLGSNLLDPLDEERPVRGRESDWRRVSRAYRFRESL